jgi:hypothetical protein
VVRLTPNERDEARRWVGTATAGIAILAVGAAGASSILAWKATTEASAAAGGGSSVSSGIQGAAPPGQGSGGGAVGSQGS